MFVVCKLQEFTFETIPQPLKTQFGHVIANPLSVKVDAGKMVGFMPVYATREDALSEHPESELMEIRLKEASKLSDQCTQGNHKSCKSATCDCWCHSYHKHSHTDAGKTSIHTHKSGDVPHGHHGSRYGNLISEEEPLRAWKLRDFDECKCGDYRHQHEGGKGKCKMPNDILHGMKPCERFRLSKRAAEIPESYREGAKHD